jgi:hypothetical protein
MALRRHGKPDAPQAFASCDARDHYQRQKYGSVRNGYREEHEPTDDRPLLIYPEPFWESSEEMGAWTRAVQACPLAQYGGMDAFAYLAEVGQLATGMPGGLRKMPRQRMTRRQMDERLKALRGQARKLEGGA